MFGCVLPGHPPQLGFQQIDARKWTLGFCVPLQSDRIVLFLTGQPPLPPGHGVTIFMSKANESLFEYLGHISNEKPSGLFTIPMAFVNNISPVPLIVGLSIETLPHIQNLESGQEQKKVQVMTQKAELARQIGQDLFNYLQSFAQAPPPGGPGHGHILLPQDVFDKWLKRVFHKIEVDARFLS
eukprot:RCo024369